jgi:hypothetical protein
MMVESVTSTPLRVEKTRGGPRTGQEHHPDPGSRNPAANRTITVDQAEAGVEARTANGDVRLGELARGTAVVQTAYGQVDVGIRQGAVAWLDLVTGFGSVQNDLDTAEGPTSGEDAVEVRARTAFGDITIHRSAAADWKGAA